MTLRIFLWSFTVAFYMYAKFHPCSSSFIGAQLIEVKKKRVFWNTLYLRNFICFIHFLNSDHTPNFRIIVQEILELLRKMLNYELKLCIIVLPRLLNFETCVPLLFFTTIVRSPHFVQTFSLITRVFLGLKFWNFEYGLNSKSVWRKWNFEGIGCF